MHSTDGHFYSYFNRLRSLFSHWCSIRFDFSSFRFGIVVRARVRIRVRVRVRVRVRARVRVMVRI